MDELPPSILSHVSIGTNDLDRATGFYDAVMPAIGAGRVMEVKEHSAVAYGRQFPEFWVQQPFDRGEAESANGAHFAFLAPSREAVHAFWDAALANGAKPDGEPGTRPQYGEPYYGCFVRDPDGNKIEAMFWDWEMAEGVGKAEGG